MKHPVKTSLSPTVADHQAGVGSPFGFVMRRRLWEERGVDAAELEATEPQVAVHLLAMRLSGAEGLDQVSGHELMGLDLIQRLLRRITDHYLQRWPGVLTQVLDQIRARPSGQILVEQSLGAFNKLCLWPEEQVARQGPEALLQELLLLGAASANPAMAHLKPIFDPDALLGSGEPCGQLMELAVGFFQERPPLAPPGLPLPQALQAPAAANPSGLSAQLEFIQTTWGAWLDASELTRLLLGQDALKEAAALRDPGPGPMGPPPVLTFDLGPDPEPEAFTPDRDWMEDVVLMARSTHVWLHQLSRRYGCPIKRLDQIPEQELDSLAEQGFTGLWLIGLWERSQASRKIKTLQGNPEALASAYALYDYAIAQDLGGEEAFEELKRRCVRRGLRLAGDMVPNHFGVSSRWLVDHPERFLSLEQPPWPNYRFTGPDLSQDPEIQVVLEDGYWDQQDAAVVFQHTDRRSGQVRYIYHGNDGTHMPWNDTAQLDYLRAETREAVIQVILDVARRFSVIRFDAAMTLARRHIRRLWHPPPGEGGAVPSRAGRGADPATFEQELPGEFWREVVDRVQQEAPDTLLLAEAFWLMEGYFVRTLGMHRVYNSAFMHMLKDEDNAGYRQTLKNVLAFSPQVLQRFVNFMSNPDEEPAAVQFGTGDKAFGVTLMMITLPGLPMFGHGQIEGFTEKYGMEYSRPLREESPDPGCVHRHRSTIFPLMRRRRLFSQATWFTLYDLVGDQGQVVEDVYAFSNRSGQGRAIVLYNNGLPRVRGRCLEGAPSNRGSVDAPELVSRSLLEALDLPSGPGTLLAFRDALAGREFLFHSDTLQRQGLPVALEGYQARVLLHIRTITDADRFWLELAQRLDGGDSVDDLELARRLAQQGPILSALARLVVRLGEVHEPDELLPELEAWTGAMGVGDPGPWLHGLQRAWGQLRALGSQGQESSTDWDLKLPRRATRALRRQALLRPLMAGPGKDLELGRALAEAAMDPVEAEVALVVARLSSLGPEIFHQAHVQGLLQVHTHLETVWFNQERTDVLLAELLGARLCQASHEDRREDTARGSEPSRALAKASEASVLLQTTEELGFVRLLQAGAQASGWRWERFMALLDTDDVLGGG